MRGLLLRVEGIVIISGSSLDCSVCVSQYTIISH